MATILIKDANGDSRAIQAPNANGRANAAGSAPVVLASEDLAKLDAVVTALGGTLSVSLAGDDEGQLGAIIDALGGTLAVSLGGSDEGQLSAIVDALGGSLSVELSPEDRELLGNLDDGLDDLASRLEAPVLPVGAASTADVEAAAQVIKAAIEKLYPPQWANRGVDTNATHGGVGTRLIGILAIPLSKSPGKIRITDDPAQVADGTTIFEGGTDSVATLHPFMIPLGIKSYAGPWRVIFGANVCGIVVFD